MEAGVRRRFVQQLFYQRLNGLGALEQCDSDGQGTLRPRATICRLIDHLADRDSSRV